MKYNTHLSQAIFFLLLFLVAFYTAADDNVSKPKLNQKQAGYYRIRVGEVDVVALSDGTVPLDTAVLNAQPEYIGRLLAKSYLKSPIDASVNAFLIELENRLILVDAGTAELYGPTLDKLPSSLNAIGYKVEDITDVLITHIHTDHTGGLMNGNKKVFPNATIHIHKKEINYWLDAKNKASAIASQKQYFEQAFKKVNPYVQSGQVKTFIGGDVLFPNIKAINSPGHTPGHTFFELSSKGEKLVFWGDILHVGPVQFIDPSVTIQFDVNPQMARQQRAQAFEDAAEKGYLVAPAHISFPGLGRLKREGGRYTWIPITYVNDAY
ncbi:MBL fold metallo-hydrolase [Marinomonas transparens]|uniref:MBL fold metallo-hydrolase n=1 Tax=Marinomonas transparens TaxID=2795388 RepID=A0A934JTH4_9GAMM|nr:MBL fold metallo-hydrolase [Marinomonas transparens]MBJ7537080.1 MBL fold metallo-hydrolase [Marinomonas transparens]